jgi:lipopolysaccharide heptosyltransferase II
LRERAYDAAAIFTTYTQSALPAALLCLQAGIPRRLAFCRENPYELLTHWAADPEPALARHEVERQLALVAHVGCTTADDRLRFRLRRSDSAAIAPRLAADGVDVSRPYVVVHPGASAPSRRWPAERFGRAASLICGELGLPVVLTGGADEHDLIETARRHTDREVQTVALAGALSLGELAALIAHAALVICNNSGPAHLAAALGTPVVDLYALTNPQHTPWRATARVLSHDVPCRNCLKSVCPAGHHDCLRGVSATAVADAALELLRGAVSNREQAELDTTSVPA